MTTSTTEQVSLATLARGGAIERFDDELTRVLGNILDPNTGSGSRVVTLKVTLKPSDDKSTAEVLVSCTSKVQGAIAVATRLFLGQAQGRAVALEHNPEQMKLDLAAKTPVVALVAAEGGK
jgi:hypothetical protein